MLFVIVDLESTCWEDVRASVEQKEIIEIGAVLLDDSLAPVREFGRFVRPVADPKLSPFCTQLTSITQDDVDGADVFPVVFHQFLDWIGDDPYRLGSWGAYDLHQFEADCARHGMALPEAFRDHANVKADFATRFDTKRCGMAAALQQAGIPLTGTHHRGIDDARNIAKLAARIYA